MARLKVDFREFFTREASRNLIPTLKKLMTQKRGVAQDPSPANAPRTVMRKGKNHWLVDTGETRRNAFRFAVRPDELLIYPGGARHSGKHTSHGKIKHSKGPNPTYRDIFRWHNTGKGRYSGIFGKVPSRSDVFRRILKEYNRQVEPQILRLWKRDIDITIKG